MSVYLIHFERPLAHARHYIGFAEDVPARMSRHRSGQGARLIRAVQAAGIGWELVRVWEGESRDFERSLKRRRKSSQFCPVCAAAKLAEKDSVAT